MRLLLVGPTLLIAACFAPRSTRALDNGLGLKPPMGWNSWFALGCSSAMNATSIRLAAQLLESKGLFELGCVCVHLPVCTCRCARVCAMSVGRRFIYVDHTSPQMHTARYEYINLDDCYIEPGAGGRNATTKQLQPDK